GLVVGQRRVIDQNVNGAEGVLRGSDEVLAIILFGDICRHGNGLAAGIPDFADGGRERARQEAVIAFVQCPRGTDDPRTLPGEQLGDLLTDPPTGTRNDGNAPIELGHGPSPILKVPNLEWPERGGPAPAAVGSWPPHAPGSRRARQGPALPERGGIPS